MEEWLQRRQELVALGVKEVDALDDILTNASTVDSEDPAADRATRSAEIAAFVAASGGD